MTAAANTIQAGPGAVSLGEIKGRMGWVLDVIPGLTEPQRRVARLMLHNTASGLWGTAGELVTWLGVRTIAEALRFSQPDRQGKPAKLESFEKTVKRARARLIDLGIVEVVEKGGHGRGNSTRFRFSLVRMRAVEEEALRVGLLQRFGAPKGDRDASQRDAAVPLPVTAPSQGDAPVPLQGGKLPASGAEPAVDKAASPVDSLGARGTGTARKGDRPRPESGTPQSPEHLNPTSSNQRANGVRRQRDGRQREMRLLTPLRGGLNRAIDALERDAQGKRSERGDRRLDSVLQRARAVLGEDAGQASLAVSALAPDAVTRIRNGWTPTDAELGALLGEAQAALRGAGIVAKAAGDGEAAGLPGQIRQLQDQVATLTRLVMQVVGGNSGLAAVG